MFWYILGLIIVALLGFYGGRSIVKVKQHEIDAAAVEEIKKLETQKQNLSSSIADLRIKSSEERLELTQKYAAAEKELAEHFNENQKEYEIRKANILSNIDYSEKARREKTNEAVVKYRQQQYEALQDEHEKVKESFLEEMETLKGEYVTLALKVAELKENRDILIEAKRMQDELAAEEQFHKIDINENDKNDIKTLKSIEPYLHNTEALNKLIWSVFYMAPVKEMLLRIVGKEKTSGIYKITNLVNGKIYIGQSVDVSTRLTNHIKSALGIGNIAHQTVHDAMRKYGLDNFTFEIVDRCTKEQLNKKEKMWIEAFAANKYGYNLTAGGSRED